MKRRSGPSWTAPIGRTYLAAQDPRISQRTWRVVGMNFLDRAMRSPLPNDLPTGTRRNHREGPLVVIQCGGSSTNHLLRCLPNLALEMDLPTPCIDWATTTSTSPTDFARIHQTIRMASAQESPAAPLRILHHRPDPMSSGGRPTIPPRCPMECPGRDTDPDCSIRTFNPPTSSNVPLNGNGNVGTR
jgi:hypothetical protein